MFAQLKSIETGTLHSGTEETTVVERKQSREGAMGVSRPNTEGIILEVVIKLVSLVCRIIGIPSKDGEQRSL